MICRLFAKTRIELPKGHHIEEECKICPLRDKNGDCPEDIGDNLSLVANEKISEIWRIFYEHNHT